VGSVPAGARGDLTDREWQMLEPLLPRGRKPGGPPKWTRRQLIDGIRWRVRTGAPWRDVPARYGTWQRVYGLFRSWQRAGVWAQILADLQGHAEAAGLITWDVSVDSTIARAHQHAAGPAPAATLTRRRSLQAASAGRSRPITGWAGRGAG
jgi:transposase